MHHEHRDYYHDEVWDAEKYAPHPSHYSHGDDEHHEDYYSGYNEYHHDSDYHHADDEDRYHHYESRHNDGPGD